MSKKNQLKYIYTVFYHVELLFFGGGHLWGNFSFDII